MIFCKIYINGLQSPVQIECEEIMEAGPDIQFITDGFLVAWFLKSQVIGISKYKAYKDGEEN